MKNTIYKIWAQLLTWLGNIRISKVIPWLYYDTVDNKIKGKQIEEIMTILKPGDIVLRGYDSYLDSVVIPDPLNYSHGAVYIGNNILIHAVAEGVSKIHVIDFCQCDRIAIFRPKKNVRKAIKIAKSYEGIGYDFLFNYGDNSIYCFELCALAYPDLKIEKCNIKKFGFIKKSVYLAQSFFKSSNLKCIYQFNPKFNINLVIES